MHRVDALVRVGRLSTEQLVVAPIRLGLGIVLVVAADALDARGGLVGVIFTAGAFGSAFLVLQDPRQRFLGPRESPAALPADAVVDGPLQGVRTGIFPSTVGLTVLAAIALGAGRPVLAAFLAGALAGLGVAAFVRGGMLRAEERRRGLALLADRRAHRLYERPL